MTDDIKDEPSPSPNPGGDRLRAAVASGVAVSIALSGGVAEPDDHVTVEQQIDAERLAEMFGRHLVPDEVAVAQAMLAGPMSWAADPSLHREFIGAELHAWMTARAGEASRPTRTSWTRATSTSGQSGLPPLPVRKQRRPGHARPQRQPRYPER